MKFVNSIGYIGLTAWVGHVLATESNSTSIESPLQDDFYKAPSGYENKQPGEILKKRQVSNNLPGYHNVDKVYQLMYRTTNSLGKATYAITSLIVPNGASNDKLLSYQIPEDAQYIVCAPSYTIRNKGGYRSSIDLALNNSIIINTPDYEGPNSAYTAGIISGHATLDSLRAALNSDIIDKDATLAMWGYSGGSIATGWANQLQPDYAPELKIAGAAVGGFVANLTAVALYVNDQVDSGLIPGSMLGLATEYPELNSFLMEELFPQNKSTFLNVRKQCVDSAMVEFASQDIYSYFKDNERILYSPAVEPILKNLTMGNSAPGAPMLVYEGMKDEIVPIKVADTVVSDYCAFDNVDILYVKDPDTTHTETEDAGDNLAFAWLMDRLDGTKVSKGCSTVTTVLSPLETTYPGGSSNMGNVSASTSAAASATTSASPSEVSSGAAQFINIGSGAVAVIAAAVALI
ncbi:hypothetical protein TRVA0_007S03026 [Trichomonascus vanleenenianus]|uniref:uncharacterized protein n=1 Tax=Trichomonascus vanleenenianus TaxID=2268995 RepID=UPI003ECB5849